MEVGYALWKHCGNFPLEMDLMRIFCDSGIVIQLADTRDRVAFVIITLMHVGPTKKNCIYIFTESQI